MKLRSSILAASVIASLALVPTAAFARGGGPGGGGGGGTGGGGGGGGHTVCFITGFDPATATTFVTCGPRPPRP